MKVSVPNVGGCRKQICLLYFLPFIHAVFGYDVGVCHVEALGIDVKETA
jgi:hypothetical protein